MSEKLRVAVQSGNVEAVRALVLAGEDVNESDECATALTWAVSLEFDELHVLEMVDCLFNLGAKVAVEGPGMPMGTSVHKAAWFGYERVLRKLLWKGDGRSALGVFDDTSRTPLMCTVVFGGIGCARAILECDVDVNAHNEQHMGDTALHLAIQKRDPELVELLLNRGADSTISGWMQITALDEARELASSSSADERRIASMVESAYKTYQKVSGKLEQ